MVDLKSPSRRSFLGLSAKVAALFYGGGLTANAAEALAAANTAMAAGRAKRQRVVDLLSAFDQRIDSIKVYGVQIDAERRFSWGVWPSRQHAFVSIQAGDHVGWSEVHLGYRENYEDVPNDDRWKRIAWYQSLKGKTVAQAIASIPGLWGSEHVTSIENADLMLLDLAGKLIGKPVNKLLGLEGKEAIPGVYCILSDDAAVVEREAKRSIEQDLKTHLKVKLYGDLETDSSVLGAARRVMGDSAYVIGDVNNGYRTIATAGSLTPLATTMDRLRQAGLSACEDPARLSVAQWGELQRQSPLDLIADEPVRHVWDSTEVLRPSMAKVFNMHPASMGVIYETAGLAGVIRSWGKRLMVGDASLVGPGCAAWTQLAIGMQADWVEAIEKPQENKVFQRCRASNPLARNAAGQFALAPPAAGFGFEIDTERLSQAAYVVTAL